MWLQGIIKETYGGTYEKIGPYTPVAGGNYADLEVIELNGILYFFTRTEKFDLFIPTF